MGRSTGHVAVHRMFAVTPKPTALIAGGNLLLTGVLQGLKELQIQVGRDLALIGCDDTDLTRLHTPSISVIARDLRQVGHVAAEALLALLDGQAGQSVVLPTRLEVRESSLFSLASALLGAAA
jgi:LacI family transcriptional regulator